MEQVEVEVVEDRTRAEGGHAVILLRGVKSQAPVGRFRLRPIEADGLSAAAKAFFERDHEPLETRATVDGIALTIGPEITENPALVPGAALEIVVPDAGLKGEFAWPALAPLARPKRRNIMTRRGADEPLARPLPVASNPAGRATRSPAEATPGPRDLPTPTLSPVEVEQTEPARPQPHEVVETELPADAAPLPRRPIVVTSLAPRHAAPEISPAAPAPPLSAPAAPRSLPPPTPATPAQRWSLTAGRAAALAIAALVAGQIVAFKALDLRISKRDTMGAAAVPVAAAPATGADVKGALPPDRPGIYEVIATGPTSPRGMAAGEVSPAKALQLAHALLHGPEPGRDAEEAIYWLKRYVLSTAGAEHSRIALTQLGSAYAQPLRGHRDLAKAVVAWELAGALGDTVAMCFLGAVHEHGLGVTASKDKAEAWYGRAAAAGGRCASAPAQTGGRPR